MAKEKPMTKVDSPHDLTGEKPLIVRRGRVESVDLYEIKDSELDILEKGSPADIQLNFAIFLLSLSFSAICSLATATFTNQIVQSVFIMVSVVGILLGVYLLITWMKSRASLKALCLKIRERISTPKLNDIDEHNSPMPK